MLCLEDTGQQQLACKTGTESKITVYVLFQMILYKPVVGYTCYQE